MIFAIEGSLSIITGTDKQEFARTAVPNLFLLAYPQREQINPVYPYACAMRRILMAFSLKIKFKYYSDKNLAYPLRFITYFWEYADPRFGTAVL